jgi:hypothetical protein
LLATALLTDACVGVTIVRYGLAELRPLPFDWTLFIIGYAFFCSLSVNDFVRTALLRRMVRDRKIRLGVPQPDRAIAR